MANATEDLALTLDEVLTEWVYTQRDVDDKHVELVDGEFDMVKLSADVVEGLAKRGWALLCIDGDVEPWHGKSTTNDMR